MPHLPNDSLLYHLLHLGMRGLETKVEWSTRTSSTPLQLLSQVTGHLPFPPSRLRGDEALRSYKPAAIDSRDTTSTRPGKIQTEQDMPVPSLPVVSSRPTLLCCHFPNSVGAASILAKLSVWLNYRPNPGLLLSLSQGSELAGTHWKDKWEE